MHEFLTLAEKFGLNLRSDLKVDEIGLDFRVATATDEFGTRWILRRPRRPDVIAKASYEKAVLSFLKERFAYKIPDWRIFSSELIAYPMLEGEPAVAPNPPHEPTWKIDFKSPNFGKCFARVLASLHQIDIEEAQNAGMNYQSPDEIRAQLIDDIALVEKEMGGPQAVYKRWRAWVSDDSYWPSHSTVIHGDLHQAHLLVDENDNITGVIDWTEAVIGDPSTDFVFHYMVFGEDGLKTLLKDYQALGARTWDRIIDHTIERAAAFGITSALYAIKTGQPELLKATRDFISKT